MTVAKPDSRRWPARIALVLLLDTATAIAADWTTPAEQAHFQTTATYAQTHAYLERLAADAPTRIHLGRFGVSPEGRDLMLVVAAKDGEFTPAAARASGKEILLVQAGIHAGEIEGNDAGLMLLRDLGIGKKHANLLDHAILVYLPIFNVDGHENSTPHHRMGQNGPRETGFRATAQYINLNRDYMKADAPEMRDWLTLFDAWMPDLFMDIHTTDGADYQYDLTWYMEEWGPLHPAVQAWQQQAFKQAIFPAFDRMGHMQSPYLDLVDHRDIRKGIDNFGSGPRFSTGYVALRNRAALLVETHMLKTYEARVRMTYDLVVATLDRLGHDDGALRKAVTQADADTVARVRTADAQLPILFKPSGESVPFVLKGYAFAQEASPVSGDTWVRYDPHSPKTYEVPFFRDLVAAESVRVPAAYVVPAAWSTLVGERLRAHGVQFERIGSALKLDVEAYQLDDPHWNEKPFEGRHLLSEFSAKASRGEQTFDAGALLVPLDQPGANLIVNLLEPRAPDSLVRWGFFDAIFEAKEGFDARVVERIAHDMLAKDPALKTEFDARVAADADFAKSPEQRLAFFHRRSPWWSEQNVGRYPIVRLDGAALTQARAAR